MTLEAKLEALDEPHVRPLETYRASLEARYGLVPHFDPDDGGSLARVLLLLETPGPRGGVPRFVSRDNASGTARNIARLSSAAGLPRETTVLWNVVPWLVHASGARNRAPTRAEVTLGLTLLPGLLALFPALAVVVLCGRTARQAAPALASSRPDLAVLDMPHPSPTFVCTSPDVSLRIVATLSRAAALAL